MKRTSAAILLALLMVTALVMSVYSQQTDPATAPIVQILQGGVHQEIPVNVTLQISTAGGIQTVTVPLKLDFNLTIGPIDAVDLDVSLEPATQFVSPLTVVAPVGSTEAITATEEVTGTSE